MTINTLKTPGLPGREIIALFAFFILLVGGSPVAMKIGFQEMSPFWLGLARFGVGALIFWVLAIYKGLEIPTGRAL